jgi:hypothetical protein
MLPCESGFSAEVIRIAGPPYLIARKHLVEIRPLSLRKESTYETTLI